MSFLLQIVCLFGFFGVYYASTILNIFFFNVAFTKLGSNLYHEFPSFNDSQGEPFENIVGKEENAGKPAFSSFPTTFSTFLKTNFNFRVTFILLSANAFNLY